MQLCCSLFSVISKDGNAIKPTANIRCISPASPPRPTLENQRTQATSPASVSSPAVQPPTSPTSPSTPARIPLRGLFSDLRRQLRDAAESLEWSCTACTFINRDTDLVCQICQAAPWKMVRDVEGEEVASPASHVVQTNPLINVVSDGVEEDGVDSSASQWLCSKCFNTANSAYDQVRRTSLTSTITRIE